MEGQWRSGVPRVEGMDRGATAGDLVAGLHSRRNGPHNANHNAGRPAMGPHSHTNRATRTSPMTEQAAMTRRIVGREDWMTVQSPLRKPTQDEISHGGGGALRSTREAGHKVASLGCIGGE